MNTTPGSMLFACLMLLSSLSRPNYFVAELVVFPFFFSSLVGLLEEL